MDGIEGGVDRLSRGPSSGIVEVLGGFLVGPAYKLVLVLVLYLLVVLVRPQGLMGRA